MKERRIARLWPYLFPLVFCGGLAAAESNLLLRVMHREGLETKRDVYDYCYKQGGGTVEGARREAAKLALDLEDLEDRPAGDISRGAGIRPAVNADEITKKLKGDKAVISFEQEALPFKLNSTELVDGGAARGQIRALAQALQSDALRGVRFRIEGHTCDIGTGAHNIDLSKRRAEAIRTLLGNEGIELSRLEVVGLGESSPKVPNTDDDARKKNRRVEIRKL